MREQMRESAHTISALCRIWEHLLEQFHPKVSDLILWRV